MDMPDTEATSNGLLAHKILNARTIAGAIALVDLARENHSALNAANEHPLNWGTNRPLCQHCWQELSVDNGLCSLCREIKAYTAKSNTGVLVFCHNAKNLEFQDVAPVSVSDTEKLVLLPAFMVAEFLAYLQKNPSPTINIVFPGNGGLTFGDALAIARYAAGKANIMDNLSVTKFYFNHSHMRAFDFDTFLGYDITTKLLEMASTIKSVFSADDRRIIVDLLKKNKVNRTYDLKRFYSMCGPSQKSVLDQIQIDRIDPQRGILLFKLARYVYRNE